MKKVMKALLTAIVIILIGYEAYDLWDNHVQREEQRKKALESEKRAAFAARIKARAQRKAAARTKRVQMSV